MCQVHDALGFTNCQKHGFAIGAAAVSEETVKFFLSLDMKLLEMISQTEMTAFIQLTNTPEPGEFRVGRVGREYSDQCEIKMINTDEVQYSTVQYIIVSFNTRQYSKVQYSTS